MSDVMKGTRHVLMLRKLMQFFVCLSVWVSGCWGVMFDGVFVCLFVGGVCLFVCLLVNLLVFSVIALPSLFYLSD